MPAGGFFHGRLWRFSEVAVLCRRIPPCVVSAVRVAHWGLDKGGGIEVVEGGEIDGDEIAAELLHVAPHEGADAAVPAEGVVNQGAGPNSIVGERILSSQEPEGLGADDGAPMAGLPADRAVALSRTGREIERRLVAYPAAVAAPPIGLLHFLNSFPEGSGGWGPTRKLACHAVRFGPGCKGIEDETCPRCSGRMEGPHD